jgi:hypothetical protein
MRISESLTVYLTVCTTQLIIMSSKEGAGREGSGGQAERRTGRNDLGRRCRGLRPDGQPCDVLLENRNGYDYCTIFHKTKYNREQVRQHCLPRPYEIDC